MHGHLDAKEKWKDQLQFSRGPVNTENYLESTENHLRSSGIFPRTHYRVDILREIQVGMTNSQIKT